MLACCSLALLSPLALFVVCLQVSLKRDTWDSDRRIKRVSIRGSLQQKNEKVGDLRVTRKYLVGGVCQKREGEKKKTTGLVKN